MNPAIGAFAFGVAFALSGATPAAEGQQAGRVYRIGFLGTSPLPASRDSSGFRTWNAFVQGLRERGWIEGKNIVIEHRASLGVPEKVSGFAAELVRARVDVLVAVAAAATHAAKRATTTIPIVSVGVQDPVESGFVQSLARPGGNITGLTLTSGLVLVGKQLALLKETIPRVSRVAVLWNAANPMHPSVLSETQDAAREMRLALLPVGPRGPDELDAAFSRIAQERAEALLVLADPMFFAYRVQLADLAAKSRLPAMYNFGSHVEAGGLMAYGISAPELMSRAAGYVDRILRGADPAVLPMEQPTKFELVINKAAARALGLTIPESLLLRADRVID